MAPPPRIWNAKKAEEIIDTPRETSESISTKNIDSETTAVITKWSIVKPLEFGESPKVVCLPDMRIMCCFRL